jgi:hypothetical protein
MLRTIARAALGAMPVPLAVRLHYALHHKRWPNPRYPMRFSEMVIARKLYDRDPRFPEMADKIAVKPFVAATIGEQYVTPTLWRGTSLPPRKDLEALIPFVLKANNGSGTNAFVRSLDELDYDDLKRRSSSWLGQSHAAWAGEWLYTKIKPELLIEPFIGSTKTLPLDYKIFVFNGKAAYVEVDTDRETEHKRTFFDRDWNVQDFSLGYPLDRRPLERPKSLEQMLALAEKLGADFSFVRIDFYDIDGRPVFGEMTFYPDAGIAKFDPDFIDGKFGGLWSWRQT